MHAFVNPRFGYVKGGKMPLETPSVFKSKVRICIRKVLFLGVNSKTRVQEERLHWGYPKSFQLGHLWSKNFWIQASKTEEFIS